MSTASTLAKRSDEAGACARTCATSCALKMARITNEARAVSAGTTVSATEAFSKLYAAPIFSCWST